MNDFIQTPEISLRRRWLRIIVVFVLCASLLAIGHWGSQWLIDIIGFDLSVDINAHKRHAMISAVILYGVLMAIPFMPAIEISLAQFAAFGPEVAMMIYAATVAALMFSFLLGRIIPMRFMISILGALGLHQAQSFVRHLAPLGADERINELIASAPKWIVPSLLKHRYIAIAVIFNLPGNAIIGGGGGIALSAGISNLFTMPRYFGVVLLATLPVPLGVMVLGNLV